MSAPSLRLALAAWVRHPRELALANASFVLATALPLTLLRLAGGGSALALASALWAAWAWTAFNWLTAWTLRIHDAQPQAWRRSREWLRAQWPERLAALAAALAGLAWSVAAARFYVAAGLPGWLAWPLLGITGGLGLWLLLALLLSVGIAAEGARPWKAVWKASALLPLAYFPAALGSLALAALLSGSPLALVGLKHWSAPLFAAPLALSPFFTPALLALHLGLQSRGLLERAFGGPAGPAPGWRELWNPWR